MPFTQLRAYDNYIKANLVLQRLEEAGIEAYLQNEQTVTIDPILSNAVGGIRLFVADTDAEKAQDLLQQMEEEYLRSLTCTRCGSHDIHFVTKKDDPGNWLTAMLSFFLGSYAIAPKYVYRCFKCNTEYDDMPETIREQPADEEN